MNGTNDTAGHGANGLPDAHHYIVQMVRSDQPGILLGEAIAMDRFEVQHQATLMGRALTPACPPELGINAIVVPRDTTDYVSDLREQDERRRRHEPTELGGLRRDESKAWQAEMKPAAARSFAALDDEGRASVELHMELMVDVLTAGARHDAAPERAVYAEAYERSQDHVINFLAALQESQPAAFRHIDRFQTLRPSDSAANDPVTDRAKRKAKRKTARKARKAGR